MPILSRPFPKFGLVRLHEIVAPHGVLPISRSTFLAGVKSGKFPRPVKIGPRITAWDAAEIRQYIAELQPAPSDDYDERGL